MKYTLLTALILSSILSITAEARTWLVEPASTGQVINIQAGIDSATAGDTVLVAPGYYIGDGNWDLDFNGKSIVVRSEEAIIGCAEGNFHGMDHVGFYFHSGEDSTAVLEGFHFVFLNPPILIEGSSPTIRNNYAEQPAISTLIVSCENSRAIIENNRFERGSPGTIIYCRNSRALIMNNEIREGESSLSPGIYCESDSSSIINNYIRGDRYCARLYCKDSHNIIKGNILNHGKGLRCLRGSYEICDNIISSAYQEDAIVCDSCNTVISNNYIEHNMEAGLVLNAGTHMITGNSITSTFGGGPGVQFNFVDSNTVFISNFVYLNILEPHPPGGGIRCYHSSPIISDNVIAYNEAYPGGGGICCEYSSPLIIRNTIAYNKAEYGGGVYCYQSSPRIENCIIAYNGLALPPYGGGIYCADELSVPTIMNCNVYGHGGDYYGMPDQSGINGNFSIAPLFCDPDNLEFTLHALSPCLPENNPYGPGAGLIGALGLGCDFVATLLQSFDAEYDDSSIEIRWTVSDAADISDFDIYRAAAPDWEFLAINDPELDGGGTSFTYRDRDISPGTAYKYRIFVLEDPAPRVLFETDRVAVPSLPLALNQNYPNPFNPNTTIAFRLKTDGFVNLSIYDAAGRLVAVLVDESRPAGPYATVWNGKGENGTPATSGVYFYRLSSGKKVISKKMILLR